LVEEFGAASLGGGLESIGEGSGKTPSPFKGYYNSTPSNI
jgi:hypothetical protein